MKKGKGKGREGRFCRAEFVEGVRAESSYTGNLFSRAEACLLRQRLPRKVLSIVSRNATR